MKKLFTTVAAAAMLLMSAGASAVHDSRQNFWNNGYPYSNYQLFNDKYYPIRCHVTATNGADYWVNIPARSWSLVMRINDASADIFWSCNPL